MSVLQVNAFSPLDLSSMSPGHASAGAQAATSTTTSGSTGAGLTSTSAGNTFLNLLVRELQNQDPSAPMDSTAMVGQMISLNQLDQLVSINQHLGGSSTKVSGTGKATGGTATGGLTADSAALIAARASLLNGSTGTPSAAQTATIAASDPTSILQLSTLNNLYGAK